jgi:hypothetical protein
MSSIFPPAPTYASPIEINPATGREVFSPLWLQWFLDVAQYFTGIGPGGSSIVHNSLSGLQGDGPEYYHLTAAQFSAIFGVAYAQLHAANIFTKGQSVTPVSLTYASTINTDASLSNTFTLVLGGDALLANPTNLNDGEIITWYVAQDGIGSHVLSYGTIFAWVNRTAPTITVGAGSVDLLYGQYFAGAGKILCNWLPDFG